MPAGLERESRVPHSGRVTGRIQIRTLLSSLGRQATSSCLWCVTQVSHIAMTVSATGLVEESTSFCGTSSPVALSGPKKTGPLA